MGSMLATTGRPSGKICRRPPCTWGSGGPRRTLQAGHGGHQKGSPSSRAWLTPDLATIKRPLSEAPSLHPQAPLKGSPPALCSLLEATETSPLRALQTSRFSRLGISLEAAPFPTFTLTQQLSLSHDPNCSELPWKARKKHLKPTKPQELQPGPLPTHPTRHHLPCSPTSGLDNRCR